MLGNTPLLCRLGRLADRVQSTLAAFQRPVLLACEAPLLDAEPPPLLQGEFEVRGYAFGAAGIAAVRVLVDGRCIGQAYYGRPRPDLAEKYGDLAGSPRAGFTFCWSTLGTPDGPHGLAIEVTDRRGATARVAGTVWLANRQPTDYDRWLAAHAPDDAALAFMRRHAARWPHQPLFSLLVLGPAGAAADRTLASLRRQVYEGWEALPAGTGADAWNRALARARGEFVGLIDAGDELQPHVLHEAAYRLNRQPLDLIYGDEDRLDPRWAAASGAGTYGRTSPCFKPDWSPDLLWSRNYIGRPWLARAALVRQLGGFRPALAGACEYDLLLRLAERVQAVGHIPTVLYSRGSGEGADPGPAREAGQQALADACRRRGVEAQVVPLSRPGLYRVRRAVPVRPRVSAIIPTRGSAQLLRPLLTSMARRSTWRPDEVLLLIADRDPITAELRALCAECDATLISYPFPGRFNWSAVNNLGAGRARGDHLLFLNDDMEVVAPEWLEALMEQAQRPEVGVVGAKLLYPNGRIQHAGMFLVDLGGGGRHSLRGQPDDEREDHGLLFSLRECAVVTGACVLTRREVFAALGGFDESMELECGDADFCLRAWRHGYRVIFTPFAVLLHAELTTRKGLPGERDVARFWQLWGGQLRTGDPFYNPNLSQDSDLHELSCDTAALTYAPPPLEPLGGPPAPGAPLAPLSVDLVLGAGERRDGWGPEQTAGLGRLFRDRLGARLVDTPSPQGDGCDLVIGWAGAATDAAAAWGVPTLILHTGGGDVRERLPRGESACALHMSSSPGLRHIHPEQVFAAALRLLSQPPPVPVLNPLLADLPVPPGAAAPAPGPSPAGRRGS